MDRNKFAAWQNHARSFTAAARERTDRLSHHVPTILLVISLIAITLLARHAHQLRLNFLEHRRQDTHTNRGDYVPTFSASTTNGDSVVIGKLNDTTARQVIFIMTSTCPYCRKTIPSWRRIALRLSSNPARRIKVLALTPDSLNNAKWFGDSEKFPFPLVVFPNRKLVQLSRATVVPQTIVLNSDGRVLYSKTGLIASKLLEDSVVSEALRQIPSAKAAAKPAKSISRNGASRPAA
jgi:peroxiredoxin